MSNEPPRSDQRGAGSKRLLELRALAAVIGLEGVALVALTGWLVVDVFTSPSDSIASAIALVLATAMGAAWLVVMSIHTLRGRSWIRGAAVTAQVMIIAVAVGAFQDMFARPDIGWMLLVPALVVLVLLFTPRVVAATRRT